MRKISIIHPSRGRAGIAAGVNAQWMARSSRKNIEYIVSVDKSDPELSKYLQYFCEYAVVNDNLSAIEAINNAAKVATGDIFVVVSDDFECPQNWDVDLLKYLDGKSDFVVKTYDGLQPWIITLPIMDRAYYNRFGYIYNPAYKHMFCDTEMTHVGDLLDRTIIVPMTFQHRHYTQPGGIKRDAISVKNDSTWGQGERIYLDGIRNNFGLKDEDIKGVLRCDHSHLNWLQSKGIKLEMV